jgi:predicted outer membrane protein
MRVTSKWFVLSVGAVVMTGAQASAQVSHYRATKNSDVRIAISKDGPPPPPEPVKGDVTRIDVDGTDTAIPPRPVLPAFRVEDYLNLNDANIVAQLASRDTMEIALARQAQAKATDQRVRDFAVALEADRTNRLAKTMHVMEDEKTGADPVANDYALARMRELYAHFDTLPAGPNWDAAFLRVQFFQQQNEIDVLNANYGNIQTGDLRRQMRRALASATDTRELVRSLAGVLAVSLP